MAIMLPEDLVWVLNLLGFNWPDVNEDDLVSAADQNRKLAGQVRQAAAKGAAGHSAVIAQLVALAAEIASAAAASVVTFGISDALGLAATAATRFSVKEIIDEAEKQIGKMIEQMVTGEALQALASSTASLVSQGVGDYTGTEHGISLAPAGADPQVRPRVGSAGRNHHRLPVRRAPGGRVCSFRTAERTGRGRVP